MDRALGRGEMIRGIDHVLAAAEMEVGRFYLAPGDDGEEPALLQCVELAERGGGDARRLALVVFPYGEANGIELRVIDFSGPVVGMPDVAIRIDPPSARESGGQRRVSMDMLLVADDVPAIAVAVAVRDHAVINLATGRSVDQGTMGEWVGFARWALVVDEAGEEIEIAAFGSG